MKTWWSANTFFRVSTLQNTPMSLNIRLFYAGSTRRISPMFVSLWLVQTNNKEKMSSSQQLVLCSIWNAFQHFWRQGTPKNKGAGVCNRWRGRVGCGCGRGREGCARPKLICATNVAVEGAFMLFLPTLATIKWPGFGQFVRLYHTYMYIAVYYVVLEPDNNAQSYECGIPIAWEILHAHCQGYNKEFVTRVSNKRLQRRTVITTFLFSYV